MTTNDARLLRFKGNNSFIFEIEDLRNLTPRSVSAFNLVCMPSDLIPIQELFLRWINDLKIIQPKFEVYENYLKLCYACIIDDAIRYVFDAP